LDIRKSPAVPNNPEIWLQMVFLNIFSLFEELPFPKKEEKKRKRRKETKEKKKQGGEENCLLDQR